jgi:hypothetical protein
VRPPVSCQISQLSTVPKQISPRAARARAPSTVSSSQRSLVPEKYGIGQQTGPRGDRRFDGQSSRRLRQIAAVRRSCQTMALWIGRPVSRSHTRVVSR